MLTWEIIFVLLLLLGVVVSFVGEKVPPDVTALSAFGFLALAAAAFPESTLPTLGQLLNVFSNPAPLTVACMFVLSKGLERCGVIDRLTEIIQLTTRFGYRPFLFALVLLAGLSSAFVNNTPIVVVLLPVVISLSRSLGVSSSKVLIPLSYASIFGGTCTLMGTSTNILGSSLLVDAGYPALRMFEFTLVGLPLLLLGTLYLFLFGKKLLPDRDTISSLIPIEERKEYLVEAFVRNKSDAVGKTPEDAGILSRRGVRVVEIMRRGVSLTGDLRKIPMEGGDRLVLACRPHGLAEAREVEGIGFEAEEIGNLEPIASREASIVEVIVTPNSSYVGNSIRDLNLRQRFRVIVLALHRQGKNVGNLATEMIREGDTLLILGANEALDLMRQGTDLVVLGLPPVPADVPRRRAPIAIGTMAMVVGAATFDILPIAAATIVGVTVMFLTGCLKPKEGYSAVDWSVLILIYGMLGMGLAMENSGATRLFADFFAAHILDLFPTAWHALVLLIFVYLAVSVMTEFLSNNASVVLMVPIAISLAIGIGADPRPYVITCCIAASASFATPIGYQTNTLVYGAGGYRFVDFLRVGVPLNLLYGLGTVLIVPMIWPLQ